MSRVSPEIYRLKASEDGGIIGDIGREKEAHFNDIRINVYYIMNKLLDLYCVSFRRNAFPTQRVATSGLGKFGEIMRSHQVFQEKHRL